MNILKRLIAAVELLLILPAALFMAALFMRNIQPPPYQPAQSARHIVDWFAARPHLGLGVLLIAMPSAALLLGCATVLRTWRKDEGVRLAALEMLLIFRTHLSALIIAGTTLLAGGILSIVAMHMIAD
jgi:hypothetical protein